ncbi:MAG: RNA polymerase sigma factor [Planctomycetes bacterium]|nr:RNA polymerase sigma factor [Planctomycetota bacterium]
MDPCTDQPETDRELLELALRGDEAAFARLVERHQDKIFRLVRGILGDWHRSEDVCQEVFTALYRRLGAFRHEARLSTWLYRVAVNGALKARKRWRRSEAVSLDAVFEVAGPPAAAGGGDPAFEGEEVLERLLAPLPEKLRVAVVLREKGGLSYEEIARVLGCTRGAVEQRLHRAMVLLRGVWKESPDRWL